jgi:hypothetical protein
MPIPLNCFIDQKAGNRNLPVKETLQCFNCREYFIKENGLVSVKRSQDETRTEIRDFCSEKCADLFEAYEKERKIFDENSFRNWIQLRF